MASKANGYPTKEFFVEMLTRDIELNDAILDLLDNCLDGVVRSCKNQTELENPNFYSPFCAEITITPTSFSIKDNCGGIPRKMAEDYAFRMGHSPDANADKPTIGIYGIGMKRAIFKMGRSAVVNTQHDEKKYSVIIPENWTNIEDWDFSIEENPEYNPLTCNGTEVIITALNPSISERWSDGDNLTTFIEELKSAIQQSYSLIIQKGFAIKINGTPIQANHIELLVQKGNDKQGIRPYIFTNQYDNVKVRLAIGFYAPMASDDDIDKMNESKRRSDDAGITIVCNDRVVLYNDKSNLTGWGTNGVPNYHTQFIGIKGIVFFESNTPQALPMTTTKRGIDHSSAIYIAVKDKICEGLKMFTNYTNQWKGRNKQERDFSKNTERVLYSDLFATDADKNYGVKLRSGVRGGNIYRPNLPKPIDDKPYRVIRFSKSVEDIKVLVGYFYGDQEESIEASIIGEKCFDTILEDAKNKG